MLQPGMTAIAVLFVLVALMLVAILWQGRNWFKAWLKGSMGFVLLAGCIITLFMLADIWSYRQLLGEQPLATLSMTQLGDQSYDVTLAEEGEAEKHFKLLGDQWQLDVRLLTWVGPLAGAGAKPIYRLDRLSGRYLSLEQERNAKRSVHALSTSRWLDVWYLLREADLWLDARYGSAVYMPMTDGAVFSVHLTAKGMLARPVNDVAKGSLDRW